MSDSKTTKIISASSATEYEPWQIPDVHTVEQQKLQQAGILTASQLEELQQQAYEEGFQQGKDEGYQQGFAQGVDEGFQQGLENAREEVAQTIKHFGQIIQFLSKPLEQVNEGIEEELINLAISMSKQIIRREISLDPGQIIAVIKESLAALPSGAKKIKVFLHPSDAQIAIEHLKLSSGNSAVMSDEPYEESWSIIAEPTISRGGCQIKSEYSQIDASVESRIAEIAARILGCERASENRNDAADNSESVDNHPVEQNPATLNSTPIATDNSQAENSQVENSQVAIGEQGV